MTEQLLLQIGFSIGMSDAWLLVLAFVAGYAVSLVPAFAPPNWAVVSLIWLSGGSLVPTGVAAAAGAAAGRATLAAATRWTVRWLPAGSRANAEALVARLDRREHRVLYLAVYSWSPLPSNVLFIAIGAGGASIRLAAFVFFACRAVSDTFWGWAIPTAGGVTVDRVMAGRLDWQSILLEVASLIAAIALFRLPWSRWLVGRPGGTTEGASKPDL